MGVDIFSGGGVEKFLRGLRIFFGEGGNFYFMSGGGGCEISVGVEIFSGGFGIFREGLRFFREGLEFFGRA